MRTKTAREIPPRLELECLRALWRLGPASVHDVRAELEPKRPLAYTTVMTLLERLERKGVACRRKQGRAFIYEAAVDRETLRREAVRELLETYFDESVEDLQAWLRAGAAPRLQEANASAREAGLDTALL